MTPVEKLQARLLEMGVRDFHITRPDMSTGYLRNMTDLEAEECMAVLDELEAGNCTPVCLGDSQRKKDA